MHNEWLAANRQGDSVGPFVMAVVESWQAPTIGIFKCKDVAVLADGYYGCEMIIRDNGGRCHAGKLIRIHEDPDSQLREAIYLFKKSVELVEIISFCIYEICYDRE